MTYKGFHIRKRAGFWYVTHGRKVHVVTPSYRDAEAQVDRLVRDCFILKDGTAVPADDFWLYAPTSLVVKYAEVV